MINLLFFSLIDVLGFVLGAVGLVEESSSIGAVLTFTQPLFVFCLAVPFLKERIIEVFGKNLYEDISLIPLLKQLTGKKTPKPFECVGTTEEIITGLYLSIKEWQGKLPSLLSYAKNEILNQEANLEKRSQKLLNSWGDDKFLPLKIKNTLREMTDVQF